MEALAIYGGNAIAAPAQEVQEITTALFNDFVAFVDRSEKTTRTYLTNLRQFMAWLKYAAIKRPVRQDIISYREWLTTEHPAITFAPETVNGWSYRTDASGNPVSVSCKANTVKLYLQSVRQFFSWTAANGLYPNVAANIHAPKTTASHKKEALTAAEVLTIENSIAARASERTAAAADAVKGTANRMQRSTEQGKRLYAMYLLAVNAGLRTIEISRANIKDLETKNGKTWLYIWGKGHAEADQRKPIAPEVKAAIDEYLNSRTDAKTGNAPLFVSTGNRSGGKRIAPTTISTMLKGAMKDAGFNSDKLTAHSLRHTAGRNVMAITGNNIYNTQQYMRHSNPATTEIYLENDTAAQDDNIANQLYRRYHGIEQATDKMQQLQSLIERMTPEQLEQITGIAAAIAK